MKQKLFWTAFAFVCLGIIRLFYDSCYQSEPGETKEQVLTIKIAEMPVMNYREVN